MKEQLGVITLYQGICTAYLNICVLEAYPMGYLDRDTILLNLDTMFINSMVCKN